MALEGGEWSAARPGRTLPLEKTRYPFYRRLSRPGGKSRPHRDLIPGHPARSSVAILTEQPGPPTIYIQCKMLSIDLRSLSNDKFNSFIKEEHQCWKHFYSSDIQRTHKVSFPVIPLYSFLIQHVSCCTSPLMEIIMQKQEYTCAGFSHTAMPLSAVLAVKLLGDI